MAHQCNVLPRLYVDMLHWFPWNYLNLGCCTFLLLQALLQYTISTASLSRQPEQQEQQLQQPDPLQQLYVGEGFDSEQVWLQLDMQLAPLRKRLRRLVGQIADEGAKGERHQQTWLHGGLYHQGCTDACCCFVTCPSCE